MILNNNSIYANKKRIEWLDIGKGIAILLTIVGHSVQNGMVGSIVRGMIFSFHMPLFFIASGYTSKYINDENNYSKAIRRSFNRLIIPAVCLCLFVLVYQCIHNFALIFDGKYWIKWLYMLIYASGVGVQSPYNGGNVDKIGIPWFLFTLFLSKTIYDYLHLYITNMKHFKLAVMLIGVIGVLFGRVQWLPFSLDIALAVLPFLLCGEFLRGIDLKKDTIKILPCSILIWACTLYMTFSDYRIWTYLELAIRRYELFPICYVCAIAGTIMVFEIAIILSNVPTISKVLGFIGRESLILLCIHTLDWIFETIWNVEGQQFLTAIARATTDVAILFIYTMIRRVIISFKKVNKIIE